jgi:hypothetical protein
MDVVREITDFYYRKGVEVQVESLPGGMEVLRAGKKRGEILSAVIFYIILNLEVGRKSESLPCLQ